ncbi:uncharacterized protein BXZ73DRAFT_81507 [Epithele typhae]|uniref:uncharacterized protein n=1 Tax=Epithele typhae TaxID=378194 RepID=UPI002008734A|nr:uncharacterized protein BXZ73DRAFT_81507 [Epithele typhae]KAH9914898.1 hypothetical protein BXZ73DRAFT_81507 [Epithele typhae]
MPGFPELLLALSVRDSDAADPRLRQLEESMGSILIGSLIALFLSGAVSIQAVLYFQMYTRDSFGLKTTVGVIWLIDLFHSAMTMVANWEYLIVNFGAWDVMDTIVWSIAVSVVLTAWITFFVHCFFIHRIYRLSRGNLWLTVPLALIALLRIVSANISTSEMIRLKSYSEFVTDYSYVFTIGLSSAASLDVLITAAMCFYLRRGRSGFGSMDKIIDSITAYTIETGMLTCVTTTVSLICWLAMPTNLVFLGLHFAISKLYANSFLATLNARKSLVAKSQGSGDGAEQHPLPLMFPSPFERRRAASRLERWSQRSHTETRLQVTVEKTIQRHDDVEIELELAREGSRTPGSARPLMELAVKSAERVYLPS